jgi:hypothetical protein
MRAIRVHSRSFVVSLVLFLGTVLLYARLWRADFINYDDADYVIANVMVRQGLTWHGILWAFATSHAGNWHPITWLGHMLNVQIFGLSAGGHHLVNVLLHAVNSVLLLTLLNRMTGALWRSAAVAALFAWHPLHVESVAWIAELKDVLSTFLFLLTLMAYVRYVSSADGVSSVECRGKSPFDGDQGSRTTRRGCVFYYVLALFLFALGLMSKPMLVTLPFVLLLIDFWPLRRVTSGREMQNAECRMPNADQGSRITHHASRIVPLLLEKLPFFALSLVTSVITYLVQKQAGAVSQPTCCRSCRVL